VTSSGIGSNCGFNIPRFHHSGILISCKSRGGKHERQEM
jgi:hypothetical protein